jgi:replication factor A1
MNRAMPAMRKGISRRVYPLVSLNPYEGNWTIKVRVSSKGPLRLYTNARGQGNVFNVELTDEEGTEIQATMFKEAADKFYDKLQLGKLYYISKGSLRAANKRYSTINNEYEMTLNQSSEVEEIPEQESSSFKLPLVKYNFVNIDNLGPYVNGRAAVGELHSCISKI